jgi:type II secretory ATPase GspE/PulE/Tfp pilus assembly ATPase PilB-like protein
MTDLRQFVEAGGLTIVTGRPGAGKTVAALEAASAAAMAGRSAVTVEANPTGEWAGLTRHSAPADAPFDHPRAALIHSAEDVVVIDEVFDADRAASAVRCALAGSAVLAVVPAADVLAALDWFTELATRDEATEAGVYAALTAVVRLGADPDVFVNTSEASRALIAGRPSAEVRAAGGRPHTNAA